MELGFRRLYWRIALYISVALLVFVLLGVASVGIVASLELENYAATRQSPLGREAAAVLSAEGKPGLQRWLRGAAIPRGVSVFVLDRDSRDILGREIPAEFASFVRASVVGPPESPAANYRPVRLAPQLIGPDGAAYAFLVLPSQFTLWGSAATALGLAVVALLVIASVAWLIARAVGRPVATLQTAVRELARGRRGARVPASIAGRRDELGALAADFNAMAAQLEELLAGRERLMAELSHELRSPLARLQAATALAAQRPGASPAEARRVEQEIGRMDRVIGDLLRYSRLGVATPVARRLVRLEALIGELCRDEELEARSRSCEIEVRAGPDLLVVGDPELLRSALENILRNAIRYAPSGSRIQVEAVRSAADIRVTVADNGPGVPEEFLEQIFAPYFRVPGTVASTDGSGLGLAIARRVFEAHAGGVRAALRAGGGLEIEARLPAAAFLQPP